MPTHPVCNELRAVTVFNTSRAAIIHIIWPNFRRIKRENVSGSCVVHQENVVGLISLEAPRCWRRNGTVAYVQCGESGGSERLPLSTYRLTGSAFCIVFGTKTCSEQKNGTCQRGIRHLYFHFHGSKARRADSQQDTVKYTVFKYTATIFFGPFVAPSWARAERCVHALDNNSYVLHARK